jgi:hypothetical protein
MQGRVRHAIGLAVAFQLASACGGGGGEPVGRALLGIWGSGPRDVFAVGNRGTILHYDGSAWSAQTSGTVEELHGVWGSGPGDVFAVGSGTMLHYDGTAWREQTLGIRPDLSAVWGSGPTNLYAVGDVILHGTR